MDSGYGGKKSGLEDYRGSTSIKRLTLFMNKVGKAKVSLIGLGTLLLFVCFNLVSLTWLDVAFGFGLEVDPPEIVVEGVPLGEKVALSDLGGDEMKLRVENKSETAYTYTINVLFPSQAQDRLKKGYAAIPDRAWLIPENKEVFIPAKSTKVVELYLEIPELKEYYDKKYQAVIEIKSKKNRPEDIFVLAVQIRMRFSTIKTEVENE